MKTKISAILLSGGIGTRMGKNIPKQYLKIGDQTIAEHSYYALLHTGIFQEIVVVSAPEYRTFFKKTCNNTHLTFATPGARRQDSLFNGLKALTQVPDLVLVHDACRPFIHENMIKDVLSAANQYGASSLAVPCQSTIKEANHSGLVQRTLNRSRLFEIQTPQVVKYDILMQGFIFISENQITVTDDVSIVELMGNDVKLVMSSVDNIKITTEKDLELAKLILQKVKSTPSPTT